MILVDAFPRSSEMMVVMGLVSAWQSDRTVAGSWQRAAAALAVERVWILTNINKESLHELHAATVFHSKL